MKIFCLVFWLASILPSVGASAKIEVKPEFYVLATNGNCYEKSIGGNSWLPMITGSKLFRTDRIEVRSGGYLSLMHISGRTREISKPGTFKIIDLSREISSDRRNIIHTIFNYIIDNISNAELLVKDKSKSKNETPVGGTIRGEKDNSRIIPKLPRNSCVIDSILTFVWYRNDSIKNYAFTLLDALGRKIHSEATADTSLTLNLEKLNIKKDSRFAWFVEGNNIVSDSNSIKRLSELESMAIQDTVKLLETNMIKDSERFKYFITAAYYAQMKIMNRAVEYYEKSLSAESGNIEGYREFYSIYLKTIGLNSEARNLMSRK